MCNVIGGSLICYKQLIIISLQVWAAALTRMGGLRVIYHPLYSMNKFVTNKSKLTQDGAQVSPYMGSLVIM